MNQSRAHCIPSGNLRSPAKGNSLDFIWHSLNSSKIKEDTESSLSDLMVLLETLVNFLRDILETYKRPARPFHFRQIIPLFACNQLYFPWVCFCCKQLNLNLFCNLNVRAGYALGIWICGCSPFFKRELWASKSAGVHSTKSFKNSGCKRWCP